MVSYQLATSKQVAHFLIAADTEADVALRIAQAALAIQFVQRRFGSSCSQGAVTIFGTIACCPIGQNPKSSTPSTSLFVLIHAACVHSQPEP